MGVAPDRLAKELTDRGQLGSVVNDILRSKAMTLLSERAAIKDESGRTVDLAALRQAAQAGAGDGEPDDAGE
jgi:trigger factor